MAEGIRIRHKTLKGVMLVVRDIDRPFDKPPGYEFPDCTICENPHECKTYHLQLDDEGAIIVSPTIYDNLMKLDDRGGFYMVNTVAKPPTQVIQVPLMKELLKAFEMPKEKMNA